MTATTSKPEPASPTYPVELTGAQIFGLADLIRLLGSARTPDGDGSLRQELLDALNEFQRLLPEPSDDDIDPYLDAVRDGRLPNWNKDALPLTETAAEWVARVHPEHAPSAKAA
jgi:hypothetical protein